MHINIDKMAQSNGNNSIDRGLQIMDVVLIQRIDKLISNPPMNPI